ncbi:RHS repeat-associated core domain-containing protein [Flavobacterium piscis]|uniref:RHS repeat-associated protein n=1 Tax=Flavobacterium piscis TaxID=1114874 RepID=A0ABU1Y5W5_9FLAO|nr:RHS repeat-associated core domain-containing protein [Flavobacterium piscis]MDR7209622.1 RHS repeat-associated protein [Flavobacterium piscis]
MLEKRLFDAWSAIIKVQNGARTILNGLTILDRGYTGHEHLQSAGLIHMNGRLYDPKLHRFLQTDNYVQDPGNTQNYNRYGYVLNNPLKYTDTSGWLTEEQKREEQLRAQRAAEQQGETSRSMTDWYAENPGSPSWFGRLFGAIGKALGITTEPTMQEIVLDEVVVYGKKRSSTSESSNAAGQGDGFNWGIPIGAAGTSISAGTEYADNLIRTSFKTGRNPVSWSKLTPKQQAWRTTKVLGKNAK